jgi:hypothetical protein
MVKKLKIGSAKKEMNYNPDLVIYNSVYGSHRHSDTRYVCTVSYYCRLVCCRYDVFMEFQVVQKISLCSNWARILAIGILSLMEALGTINFQEWIEWSVFGAVMAICFGLEFVYKIREGICYCKLQSSSQYSN